MPNHSPFDNQSAYWDDAAATKSFSHPVDVIALDRWIGRQGSILDFGCGYGRVMAGLNASGFQNVVGVDSSNAMIERGRQSFPGLNFQLIDHPPELPFPDGRFDAVLLFSVLTCIPSDEGQRSLVAELTRVLRPGGLLYVSDLFLQSDERNRTRYERDASAYGAYGVFALPEGVVVRHHTREWIAELLSGFETLAVVKVDLVTMNGHSAAGFQWFAGKPNATST